jgi:hypothetical protein
MASGWDPVSLEGSSSGGGTGHEVPGDVRGRGNARAGARQGAFPDHNPAARPICQSLRCPVAVCSSVLVLESGNKIGENLVGSVQDHREVPVVGQQPFFACR